MCMNSHSLQLTCSGFSVFVIGLFLLGFLKVKACVIAKLVACFALKFFAGQWNPSRWVESPHLQHLSLFLWANLGSKLFLYQFGGLCTSFLCCTCFCLAEDFFFFYLPFYNSVLVVHYVDLGCLGITSHLFDVSCCGLGAFHLLGKLTYFASQELVKVHTSFFDCLGDKLLIFEKKKISLCSILAVSRGYLTRLICAWTVLYHLSMLLVPCLKLGNKSKWVLTSFSWGLQNSSKHSQIVSKLRSSLGRF